MDIFAAVLIIGASVSSEYGGTPSPGHLLAEHIGAPHKIVAHYGVKLERVLREAEADIPRAAMLVSVDGLYWDGTDRVCDAGLASARRLFDLRGNRPMVLGAVPAEAGPCASILNSELELRCTGACILIKPEGDLTPARLHPDIEFMKRFVASIYGRPANDFSTGGVTRRASAPLHRRSTSWKNPASALAPSAG